MQTYKVTYEYKGKIGMEISADSEELAAEQVKGAVKGWSAGVEAPCGEDQGG